jgi:hypothetical protein
MLLKVQKMNSAYRDLQALLLSQIQQVIDANYREKVFENIQYLVFYKRLGIALIIILPKPRLLVASYSLSEANNYLSIP